MESTSHVEPCLIHKKDREHSALGTKSFYILQLINCVT